MLRTVVIAASLSFCAAVLMSRATGPDTSPTTGPIAAQAATAEAHREDRTGQGD
ncbi:hypothetical protein [Novosphingobium resinovorum]|uniref:hypothetical protein n=1 Tax=Novosphingobium resinovorum TaxID=158500 RepID=UPI002ED30F38|nr:hypothetical protein [Novosphingobium resinovorum]